MQLDARLRRISHIESLVLAVQIVLLFFLLAVGWLYRPDTLQAESLIYSGCVFFLVQAFWLFWSWSLVTNRWFDPYLLFLLSAILFNGGQAILEVFHLNPTGFLMALVPEDLFSYDITLKTLYLVTFGLAALHLGALMSAVIANRRMQNYTSESVFSKSSLRHVYRAGRIILFIAILPTVLTLKSALVTALSGGYSALYQQDAVGGGVNSALKILTPFLFPGTFLIIATAPKNSKLRIFSLGLVLLYSGASFFLGTRAAAAMPLLALLWLWNGVVRSLPKILLIGTALLLVGVVFPLVSAMRSEIGTANFSLAAFQQTFASIDNPIVSAVAEMGGSMRTIAWTLQLVPDVRELALGSTYLTGILILIPNVFGAERHPALTLFGYDIPDYWLAWEVEPIFAERGGSFGFSFIAEAYLNFGWAAPLALGVIGLLYGSLVAWSVNDRNPFKMALIATFVSSFLFYARGSSELVFRPFVWYCLLPYLLVKFIHSSKTNSAVKSRGVNQ